MPSEILGSPLKLVFKPQQGFALDLYRFRGWRFPTVTGEGEVPYCDSSGTQVHWPRRMGCTFHLKNGTILHELQNYRKIKLQRAYKNLMYQENGEHAPRQQKNTNYL